MYNEVRTFQPAYAPTHMRWPQIPAVHVYLFGDDESPYIELVHACVTERMRQYTVRFFRVESAEDILACELAQREPIYPVANLFTESAPEETVRQLRGRILGRPWTFLGQTYSGKVGE